MKYYVCDRSKILHSLEECEVLLQILDLQVERLNIYGYCVIGMDVDGNVYIPKIVDEQVYWDEALEGSFTFAVPRTELERFDDALDASLRMACAMTSAQFM